MSCKLGHCYSKPDQSQPQMLMPLQVIVDFTLLQVANCTDDRVISIRYPS